jgi:hypothetical protein
MNFRPLFLRLLAQLTQFKAFSSDLDIVTKEENGGQQAKGCEIKRNLKGLFM